MVTLISGTQNSLQETNGKGEDRQERAGVGTSGLLSPMGGVVVIPLIARFLQGILAFIESLPRLRSP